MCPQHLHLSSATQCFFPQTFYSSNLALNFSLSICISTFQGEELVCALLVYLHCISVKACRHLVLRRSDCHQKVAVLWEAASAHFLQKHTKFHLELQTRALALLQRLQEGNTPRKWRSTCWSTLPCGTCCVTPHFTALCHIRTTFLCPN